MVFHYRYFFAFLALSTVFLMTVSFGMSVIRVDAKPLYDEYSANYVRAKQKYQKYEYFLVSGEISKIESTWNESRTDIRLKTGYYSELFAQVNTNSYEGFLSSLNEKENVILLCPVQSSEYTRYGWLKLGNCEPDTRYQYYLSQELEKQRQQEAFRLAQLAKAQEDLSTRNITITTAPSQLGTYFNSINISKFEKIIVAETAFGDQAKYFVRYKGELDDVMALESVDIVLPHDTSLNDNYQIYSEEDKIYLINQELQAIEQLLNSKQISTAIADIDVYRAKLYSQQLNRKNVLLLNNYGYYLEQNGLYVESAIILEEIVRQHPQRVAARINLGDAYWGINTLYQSKAIEHYRVYISLMEKNGRKNRIPQRVYDRIR